MRASKRIKKTLSFLLCLCMLVQNAPLAVFAAAEDNLCGHHMEHTAECCWEEGLHDCQFVCEDCAAGEPEVILEEPDQEPFEEPSEEPEPSTEAVETLEEVTEPAAEEVLPQQPQENVYEAVTQLSEPEVDLPDNGELFAMYADQVLYGYAFTPFGIAAGSRLSGDEKLAYEALKKVVAEIAAGQRASTVVSLGYGSYNVNVNGTTEAWTPEITVNFTEPRADFDLDAVVRALLSDCPFEMYWYDKTPGHGCKGVTLTTEKLCYIEFQFSVAGAYSNGDCRVNTAKTAAASLAAANANAVVEANADKTPYERLVAYRDYLCKATDYNHTAADVKDTPYGDPWQLIYVFDGDPATTVVCEGYAKAFQYLCDLDAMREDYDEDDVLCICASGYLVDSDGPGGHMWNVVTLDDQNYLVDVTNCDFENLKEADMPFLRGGAYQTGITATLGGYRFPFGLDTITFACEDLNLAEEDYTPPAAPEETRILYVKIDAEAADAYLAVWDAAGNQLNCTYLRAEGDYALYQVPAKATHCSLGETLGGAEHLAPKTEIPAKVDTIVISGDYQFAFSCGHRSSSDGYHCDLCGGILPANAEASVTSGGTVVCYATLKEALSKAVADSDTVRLLKNATLTESVNGNGIMLYLCGYDLTIAEGCSLDISGGTLDGSDGNGGAAGSVTGNSQDCVLVAPTYLKNITITNNHAEGYVLKMADSACLSLPAAGVSLNGGKADVYVSSRDNYLSFSDGYEGDPISVAAYGPARIASYSGSSADPAWFTSTDENFMIWQDPADLSCVYLRYDIARKAEASLSATEIEAGGAVPTVTVTGDVTENTDYTVSYCRDSQETTDLFTTPGIVTVKITGMGNYAGEIELTYEVKEPASVYSGWTELEGSWYYYDPETNVPVTGLTKVPYPDASTGLDYVPDQQSVEYAASKGQTFIDAETGWFLFGEDGVFQSANTGMGTYNGAIRYLVKGFLPWHYGLVVDDNADYYYFTGDAVNGGNILATGDVYLQKTNGLQFSIIGAAPVTGGVYTFREDGKLLKAQGITNMANGAKRYYDNYRLMTGLGLTKVGDNFIYVRSGGELVVNAEYWVPANSHNITSGIHAFDANGYLIIPELAEKDGVYREGNAWFYYEGGELVANAGLILFEGSWYDESGVVVKTDADWIYVRSNGQLATGTYYMTNVPADSESGQKSGDKGTFDQYGVLVVNRHGIVKENGKLYYYQNGKLQYNAGVIEIAGNYYYVRSNGQLAVGAYWITNVGDSGIVAKQYTFDENGIMQNPQKAVADGIVNGYYYVNGKIAYGAGLIYLEEEGAYIYVRSNGQLAIGKYWPTNTNGLDISGQMDFGTDGKCYI